MELLFVKVVIATIALISITVFAGIAWAKMDSGKRR